MGILNYTTTITAQKTIGEIQGILSEQGASQVSVDYDGGAVSAVQFAIDYNGKMMSFRLPCNKTGVLECLKETRLPKTKQTIEQAERVAWRIVKDWVEAQMAIIESNQAELAEVFFPYMVEAGSSRTMFQTFQNQQLQLTE